MQAYSVHPLESDPDEEEFRDFFKIGAFVIFSVKRLILFLFHVINYCNC